MVKKWKSDDSTATLKETDGEQERVELAHIDGSKPLQASDSLQPLPNDVGAFVGSTISTEKRYELLNNQWMPAAYYKFPAVVQQSGHKGLSSVFGCKHGIFLSTAQVSKVSTVNIVHCLVQKTLEIKSFVGL